MGRFHRHDDGQVHHHDHAHDHDHDHQHDHSHDHGDHAGYATGTERVMVLERIFDENDKTAAANRADFDNAGLTAVNLMSSPGAGKTTLLAETLQRLDDRLRVSPSPALYGDLKALLGSNVLL